MGWFLLSVATLVVMFFDVGFAVTQVWDWRASNFPTTSGTVLSTRIDQRSGKGTYYRGVIRYRYTVSGHVYESERMRYTRDWMSRESAQRFIDAHKAGQPIRVYYNPRAPNDAVLFPSMWDDARGFLTVLIPFNAVIIIFWVCGIRSIGKSTAGAATGRFRGIRFATDKNHGS